MDLIKETKKGLALAAGGARGAYQAGALLALAELGFKFNSISGTSVGVLNGAYYVQGGGTVEDMKDLCSLWREIGKVGIIEYNSELTDIILNFGILKPGSHILNPKPLQNILDKHLDYSKICNSKKEFIITTIPSIDPISDILVGTFQKPKYFYSKQIKPEILRKAILAAIAIPIAFPCISIDGTNFTDAGLSTPLPSKVLYDNGVTDITSIFLADSIIQNRLDYPNAIIFQIRPSLNISPKLMSMLDFSEATIEKLLKLGRDDAKRYIKNVSKIRKAIDEIGNNRTTLDNLMDELPI